jgi:nucleotide-binding universal stress UspA family protein
MGRRTSGLSVTLSLDALRDPMIRNILFAHDFSPSAERAFAYGVDLVERTGAALHVVYVQETSLGPFVKGNPSPLPGEEQLQHRVQERVRNTLASYSLGLDDDSVSCEAERSGAIAPALVEIAEERGSDLIVMGTHGRRGVRRALFGSVAEEVLRTAPCPLFTTRPEDDDAEALIPAAVERIVVPIDFSESSRTALQYAARLASVYDTAMTLVHAVELPSIPTVYQVEFSGLSPAEIEERAQDVLEDWGASVAANRDLSYVVETGEAVPTLLQVASNPSDLVVMATRGLSGVKRTMLGSVAEGVLRRAPGPVISA